MAKQYSTEENMKCNAKKYLIMVFCMIFAGCNVFMGLSIREISYVRALPERRLPEIKYSPDGNKIAAAYDTGEIIIWDANTYNHISVYKVANDYFSLDFSPDGKFLVYGTRDATVTLFDVENNCVMKTFPAESGYTSSVRFSSDGKYIAAGYSGNRVIIWDIETGNIVYHFFAPYNKAYRPVITSVAFSPDGKRLISADTHYRINIWNMENGNLERQLTGNFRYDEYIGYRYHVIFDKTGNRIISGSSQRKEIVIWDTVSGDIIRTLPGNNYSVYSLCISPDGNTIAAGSMNTLSLWNISNGKIILKIKKRFLFEVASLDFHPKNNNILMTSGSPDGLIKLWDITNGELITELSIDQILTYR